MLVVGLAFELVEFDIVEFDVLLPVEFVVFVVVNTAVLLAVVFVRLVFALFAVLFAAGAPQAIPRTPNAKTDESAITFFICLIQSPVFLKD